MLRLRECRERLGYSQKYVALTIGVKPPSVNCWESGQKQPTISHLITLANLYGVTVDYLVGNTDYTAEGLDATESRLLSDFRTLNKQGQEFILQTLYTACSSGIYKKPGNVSDVENVTG